MSTKQPTTHEQPHRSTERTREFAKTVAQTILQTIERDHRFCANCYQQVREVEAPPGSHVWSSEQGITRGCAVGFSYPTENTIEGVGVVPGDDQDLRPVDGMRYTSRRICECGACHHTTQSRPLKIGPAVTAARNLSETIDTLRDEYETASGSRYERVDRWRHSTDRLVEALKHLKKQPDYQGAEKPVFRAALATALRTPDYTH